MARISTYADGGAILPTDDLICVRSGGNVRVRVLTYDATFYFPGVPANDELLTRIVLPRACYIPDTATDSQASAGTAATGALTVNINKNGSSVGTIAWSASGTVGTFTVSGDQTFAAGDVLDVQNAAAADATLADISITIALLLGAP